MLKKVLPNPLQEKLAGSLPWLTENGGENEP